MLGGLIEDDDRVCTGVHFGFDLDEKAAWLSC
jgi:hypothetical protein